MRGSLLYTSECCTLSETAAGMPEASTSDTTNSNITIPPPVQLRVGPIFATLLCFTLTTLTPLFSQSERIEPSSFCSSYTIRTAERPVSIGLTLSSITSLLTFTMDSSPTYGRFYDVDSQPRTLLTPPDWEVPESQQTT